MNKRKYLFAFMSALLSFGILAGCNNDNEPDPTEEPSEQQQEKNEELEEENG